MSDDHAFCRAHLAEVMKDVRELVPADRIRIAWSYRYNTWYDAAEFHGPNDFYWHGRACCRWEARAKGWEAWLEKHHPEHERREA